MDLAPVHKPNSQSNTWNSHGYGLFTNSAQHFYDVAEQSRLRSIPTYITSMAWRHLQTLHINNKYFKLSHVPGNKSLTLEVQTYQKPHNLYQYLDFTSVHPQTVYKGIIKEECTWYPQISIFTMPVVSHTMERAVLD